MAYASKKKLSDNSIVPLGSNLYGTAATTVSDSFVERIYGYY